MGVQSVRPLTFNITYSSVIIGGMVPFFTEAGAVTLSVTGNYEERFPYVPLDFRDFQWKTQFLSPFIYQSGE